MKHFIQLILLCLLSPAVWAQGLVKMEYFFDADPGTGNGPAVTYSQPLDSLNSSSSIVTSSLAPGFHTLHYRVKDTDGAWSLYQTRSFFIADSTENAPPAGIAKLEYFFDADPGTGNGPSVTYSQPLDSLNSSSSIVTSSLAPGFHTLNYRVRDEEGRFSLYKKHTFYVQDTSMIEADPLVEMEFRFDGGPGVSNAGLAMGLAMLDTADITASFHFGPLGPGFHHLFIRSRYQSGEWGLYQARTFFVSDSTETEPTPPLTGLEYYVDADPGVGAGNFLPLGPLDSLDSLFVFPMQAGLSLGWHTLSLRVQDAEGAWSISRSDSFQVLSGCSIPAPTIQISGNTEICPGDSVQFSVLPGYASYSWNNGANTASVWIQAAGSYTITVTDTAGCAGTSSPVTVSLLPAPNPVILVNGPTQFCYGDSVGMITDGIHDSYLWSTGDTTAFTFASQSGSYFVTVTDDGCTGTSEPVQLTEIITLTPSVVQVAPDSLRSNLSAASYIWYFNAGILPDATTRTIHVTQPGIYQVQIATDIGCISDKSEFFTFTATHLNDLVGLRSLQLYPNPGNGWFTLDLEAESAQSLELHLSDATGKTLWRRTESIGTGPNRLQIDLRDCSAGLYLLHLHTGSGRASLRLVRE